MIVRNAKFKKVFIAMNIIALYLAKKKAGSEDIWTLEGEPRKSSDMGDL